MMQLLVVLIALLVWIFGGLVGYSAAVSKKAEQCDLIGAFEAEKVVYECKVRGDK